MLRSNLQNTIQNIVRMILTGSAVTAEAVETRSMNNPLQIEKVLSNTLMLSIHRAPFVFRSTHHNRFQIFLAVPFLSIVVSGLLELDWTQACPRCAEKGHHCRVILVLVCHSPHRYKPHSFHS